MVNRLIPPPTRLTNEVQEVQVFFILVEYVINQLFLIPAHHIIVLTAFFQIGVSLEFGNFPTLRELSSSRQPGGCGLSWSEITVIKTGNIIVFQVVIWPVQLNPVNENLPHKEANFPAML